MTKDSNLLLFESATSQVAEVTCNTSSSYVDTWQRLREQWLEHYSNDIPNELIQKRNQLLIAVRFTECFQTLCWIESLALGGGYYLAIRELRCLLESIVQAYYIDIKYPDIDVSGKLAVLNEMMDVGRNASFGTGLIKRASPPDQAKIIDLYRKLCKFVHPTVAQMEQILGSPESDRRIVELLKPTYDHELFEQCCQFSKQVVLHVIDINRDFIERITA